MVAQGEREPADIDMGEGLLDPMAQDEEVEQEMLVVTMEEQFFPPQMDPEPEMGAAAAEAAVYDTSPPLPSLTKTLPRFLPKRFARVYPTWPKYAPCWQ